MSGTNEKCRQCDSGVMWNWGKTESNELLRREVSATAHSHGIGSYVSKSSLH